MSRGEVELVWSRRLLRRLRIEGTSIVLAEKCTDAEIREAVVAGRSFVNEDGSYIVLAASGPRQGKAP